MQKEQCDAYVAALSLVAGNGGFILTESAENDIRPQVNSRQCFLGLAVALRSPNREGWETKVTYKDATRNQSYEVNGLEHVEVDGENRSLFLHCRGAITGTLFIFGMTPYQNGGKTGFDLWNEASKETRKWKPNQS